MTVVINGTTGIVGATWTTAGRPSSPVTGQRGFNTTTNAAEIYNGTQWNPMSNGFSATGGTITESAGYTIHTFTSSGTFTPNASGRVETLVVAGGGGGGTSDYEGGGGAGGLIYNGTFDVAATGLSVTIGTGGASGASGTNSVFSTLTALGGGRDGVAGGSGGGSNHGGSTIGGAATQPSSASGGFGNTGGYDYYAAPHYGAGGGGGAGAVGVNGTSTTGGNGGEGLAYSISGSSVAYAGGGGGGAYSGGTHGIGGTGGGGNAGSNATANTGGGGGRQAAGGSGIVIIRYWTAGEASMVVTVGTTGTVASVNMLQTRTQGDFVANPTGNGTIVTPLNITFTPKQAGNKVILEFTVNGEGSHEVGWIVTRNDVNLPDTTDGSNNMWAVTTTGSHDGDISSTPNTRVIRILDLNTLAVASTYKVLVRCTYTAQTNTYKLNRTHNSTGADYRESLLSVVTATEIWT